MNEPCSLRRRRHDEGVTCHRIHLMRQTALRGRGACGCTVYLGNIRSTVESGKSCPGPCAAEHASTTRIECGGWASLPAEDSRPRLRETWRPWTPPRRYTGSTRVGGPDGREEVPDLYGGSAPSAIGSELLLLMDTWYHLTRPRAGSGSGAVGAVR